MRIRTIAVALLLGGAVAATTACSPNAGRGGTDTIVAGFYPLQFLAERVGGPDVTVANLAKPGAEPHDLELSPQQVAQVADARLVVYLAGFQPQVDEAVAQQAKERAFDAGAVEPLREGNDPHVWLDPTRLATIADRLAERLGQLDPAHAADYTARAKGLRADLETLDKDFAEGLKTCQRREIVVSHAAFGYLAARYGLEQVAITGLTPEDEPTPQRLAEVTAMAKAHGATTIFFESLVSPKVADSIARSAGAQTAVLDPIEGLPEGSTEDYLSVMRANLAMLRPALGCG